MNNKKKKNGSLIQKYKHLYNKRKRYRDALTQRINYIEDMTRNWPSGCPKRGLRRKLNMSTP
jgi:hypothetical protein